MRTKGVSIEDPVLGELSSRSRVYKLLCIGFTYPGEELAPYLVAGNFGRDFLDSVKELPGTYNLNEELSEMGEALGNVRGGVLQAEYILLFSPGDETMNPPPYETEYGSSHIFSKVQELADISGFYRAFGFQVSSNLRDRPDYIGTELEFMHLLIEKEIHAREKGLLKQASITRDAQQSFLRDHLARWLPTFCTRIQKGPSSPYYRTLAKLTLKFLQGECSYLSVGPISEKRFEPRSKEPTEFTCPADGCPSWLCG